MTVRERAELIVDAFIAFTNRGLRRIDRKPGFLVAKDGTRECLGIGGKDPNILETVSWWKDRKNPDPDLNELLLILWDAPFCEDKTGLYYNPRIFRN